MYGHAREHWKKAVSKGVTVDASGNNFKNRSIGDVGSISDLQSSLKAEGKIRHDVHHRRGRGQVERSEVQALKRRKLVGRSEDR